MSHHHGFHIHIHIPNPFPEGIGTFVEPGPVAAGTIKLGDARDKIRTVLDELWTGRNNETTITEGAVIKELTAALADLGESWTPPNEEVA